MVQQLLDRTQEWRVGAFDCRWIDVFFREHPVVLVGDIDILRIGTDIVHGVWEPLFLALRDLKPQSSRGKVSTREGRQNAAKVNLAAEDQCRACTYEDISSAVFLTC